MEGLELITAHPPVEVHPARMDIACMVGLVARREVNPRRAGESDESWLRRVLPAWLASWLAERRWLAFENGQLRPGHPRSATALAALEDVPVPLESWDAFDSLFAWDQRPLGIEGRTCDSRMGAAVRDFFEQGGRRLVVVRVGDPAPVLDPVAPGGADPRAVRLARLTGLIPDLRRWLGVDLSRFPGDLPSPDLPANAWDASTWRGINHLFGLAEVSFLTLPDLPDLLAAVLPAAVSAPAEVGPERFIELAERVDDPPPGRLRHLSPPRLDETGFRQWAAVVKAVGEALAYPAHGWREVQMVAALPLPLRDVDQAGSADLQSVSRTTRAAAVAQRSRAARFAQKTAVAEVRTAFVQLVYPWIEPQASARLPGGWTAPDGPWCGVLARNALTRGTWRSLQRQPVVARALEPVLNAADTRDLRPTVSLVGPGPGGFRILSDVTTDDDAAYRPAGINRLISAVVRAARISGEGLMFQNNGTRLWAQLREALQSMLALLWADGALNGSSPEEAFEVRCDASTMSPADIDAGRLVAKLTLNPAASIERIVVVLSMAEGGQVTLLSTRRMDLRQAV